jgi:ketosteroid isomerase-like protein
MSSATTTTVSISTWTRARRVRLDRLRPRRGSRGGVRRSTNEDERQSGGAGKGSSSSGDKDGTPENDDANEDANERSGFTTASSSSSSSSGTIEYAPTTPTRDDYARALDAAVAAEDYAEAARLRDLIRDVANDSRRAIEDANEAFYRAFRAANIDAMSAVWIDGPHARCAHPGSAPVVGSADVRASWEIIFASVPGGLDVHCLDANVYAGDGWGMVTCVERTPSGSLTALNVFERRPDGSWGVVAHQAHGVVALGNRL